MKKFLVLAIAALVSLGASAQLISSNMITKETKPAKSGYSRFGISYSSFSFGAKGFTSDDDWAFPRSASGVSLDFLKGISVSNALPLYIETGLTVNVGFRSKDFTAYDYEYDRYGNVYYDTYDVKTMFGYIDLRVPVNVTYRYEVMEGLKISPFAGLYLKGNVLGMIYEDDEEETYNMFSKDDYGDSKATRFNVGFNIGVNVDWKKIYLGLSYATDFNKFYGYDKAGSASKFSVTLGFIH